MFGDEAAAYGRYVMGFEIDAAARDAYERAARTLGYDASDAMTRFVQRHPWTLPALDAALALTRPDTLLRKKLLLMAAVLETRPEYSAAFLPRDRSWLAATGVAVSILRAGLLAVFGLILARFVR